MHVISEGVNPLRKPIREPHFSLIENFLSHLGILKSTPRLYEASMDEQTILPRPPLLSREGQLPKRPRALTATNTEQSLPPHRRKKAPPLPITKAFMFSGVHPNYTRHALDEDHKKMEIRCAQQGCTYSKVIGRSLSGTNNYNIHYRKCHPGIPTNAEELQALKERRAVEGGTPSVTFFNKPKEDQTHMNASEIFSFSGSLRITSLSQSSTSLRLGSFSIFLVLKQSLFRGQRS